MMGNADMDNSIATGPIALTRFTSRNTALTAGNAVHAELAPTGRLRAGINYGNVILARKHEKNGELSGVHVDLARELGRQAGVPVELLGCPAAGDLVAGLQAGELDIALLSYEPTRAGEVVFSPPYLEVDATYLVPPGSMFRSADEVDRDGVNIAITARSVYEYYLLEHLKFARLVNAPSTHAAFALFARGKLHALVGLRPRLAEDALMMPGSRVLDGRFMMVQQAVASPVGRDLGAQCIRKFIKEAIASGFVSGLLEKNGLCGITVASGSAV